MPLSLLFNVNLTFYNSMIHYHKFYSGILWTSTKLFPNCIHESCVRIISIFFRKYNRRIESCPCLLYFMSSLALCRSCRVVLFLSVTSLICNKVVFRFYYLHILCVIYICDKWYPTTPERVQSEWETFLIESLERESRNWHSALGLSSGIWLCI